MSVAGKSVVVVGASSGVGRGIAAAFARQGAHVVASARREHLGEELAAEAAKEGHDLTFVPGDVQRSADCDRVVQTAVDAQGRLDVLVYAAGIEGDLANLHELRDDQWDDVLATNLTGAFYCARAALARMVTTGGGLIVNIASINAAPGHALAHMAPYNASKAGLVHLTNTIAVEYLFQGVRANVVVLGGAEGETAYRMEEKLGRLAQGDSYQRPKERSAFQRAMIQTADDLGDLFVHLADDEARLLTGAVIAVDRSISAGFMASAMIHGASRQVMP